MPKNSKMGKIVHISVRVFVLHFSIYFHEILRINIELSVALKGAGGSEVEFYFFAVFYRAEWQLTGTFLQCTLELESRFAKKNLKISSSPTVFQV